MFDELKSKLRENKVTLITKEQLREEGYWFYPKKNFTISLMDYLMMNNWAFYDSYSNQLKHSIDCFLDLSSYQKDFKYLNQINKVEENISSLSNIITKFYEDKLSCDNLIISLFNLNDVKEVEDLYKRGYFDLYSRTNKSLVILNVEEIESNIEISLLNNKEELISFLCKKEKLEKEDFNGFTMRDLIYRGIK